MPDACSTFVAAAQQIPASNQCQAGLARNVTASNHEWHATLNQEIATVPNDIKQNHRVCPPRSREAGILLYDACHANLPEMQPKERNEKTWSGRWMLQKENQKSDAR